MSELKAGGPKVYRYKVNSSSRHSYCCGIKEMGSIQIEMCDKFIDQYQFKHGEYVSTVVELKESDDWLEDKQKAIDLFVKRMKDRAHDDEGDYDFPFTVTLVNESEAEQELIKVLSDRRDCKVVHKWMNPNTDNRLVMFLFPNDVE